MSRLQAVQNALFASSSRRQGVLALSFLALAPAIRAGESTKPQPPRAPVGIHAEVNMDEYQGTQLKSNPSMTTADLQSYFNDLYNRLLSNTAVSGIALSVTWKRLEPNAPTGSKSDGYDWSWTDNLFLQVSAYNAANAGTPGFRPKTVQLGVSPGFNSPEWLLKQLGDCDYLFDSEKKPPAHGAQCGKATFSGFVEGGRKTIAGVETGVPLVLPMPWDPIYKSAWEAFLTALAKRYEPYAEFVSIGVAGPTASSGEMILPNDLNTKGPQLGGLKPDRMWSKLLEHFFMDPKLHDSDQAFVDEWEKAIDMYGKIFSGITLAVNTGSGLPRFNGAEFTTKPSPSCGALDPDCKTNCPKLNLDCAAETEIMNYFAQRAVGGPNGKSSATDGMKGFGPYIKTLDLGEPAVKWRAQNTDLLGGIQFATSFSMFPAEEGCVKMFPPKKDANKAEIPITDIPAACLNPNNTTPSEKTSVTKAGEKQLLISPEQAAYNVLLYFFTGTPAAGVYHQPMGTASLNYLQIYGPDIEYANRNPDLIVNVQEPNSTVTSVADTLASANFTTLSVSAQTLLTQANEQLWSMARQPTIP